MKFAFGAMETENLTRFFIAPSMSADLIADLSPDVRELASLIGRWDIAGVLELASVQSLMQAVLPGLFGNSDSTPSLSLFVFD
jgi:hypothetical protein